MLAHPNEIDTVPLHGVVAHPNILTPVDARLHWLLDQPEHPLLVAVSPELRRDGTYLSLLENLDIRDPRIVRSVSVLSLFEQQQERLPPVLMRDSFFTFDELPWAASLSFQVQLKRLSDLLLAFLLLLITSPFVDLLRF